MGALTDRQPRRKAPKPTLPTREIGRRLRRGGRYLLAVLQVLLNHSLDLRRPTEQDGLHIHHQLFVAHQDTIIPLATPLGHGLVQSIRSGRAAAGLVQCLESFEVLFDAGVYEEAAIECAPDSIVAEVAGSSQE